jgi:hypothetical protein
MTPTAIITGASSGIGAATARLLAQKGLNVALIARRLDKLEGIKAEIDAHGRQALIVAADLTQETECADAFTKIKKQFGSVEILVNNAGTGWYGYFNDMGWDEARALLQLNIMAVVQMTALCLSEMLRQQCGHIINISSIAGSLPAQGNVLYSASKAFVDTYTTALYRETRGTPIHISLVRPGPVHTEFFDVAQNKKNSLHNPLEKVGVSAEAVAQDIWRLVQRPRRVIHIPRWVGLAPLFEFATGWVQNLIGPVDLNRQRYLK